MVKWMLVRMASKIVGGHDGRCEGGTIFEGGICGGVGGKG